MFRKRGLAAISEHGDADGHTETKWYRKPARKDIIKDYRVQSGIIDTDKKKSPKSSADRSKTTTTHTNIWARLNNF